MSFPKASFRNPSSTRSLTMPHFRLLDPPASNRFQRSQCTSSRPGNDHIQIRSNERRGVIVTVKSRTEKVRLPTRAFSRLSRDDDGRPLEVLVNLLLDNWLGSSAGSSARAKSTLSCGNFQAPFRGLSRNVPRLKWLSKRRVWSQ